MWHTSSYSPAEITPSMVGVVPCGAYSVRVGTAFFRLRFSRRRTRARLALVAASMRLARVRKEEWARKRRRRAQASCRNFAARSSGSHVKSALCPNLKACCDRQCSATNFEGCRRRVPRSLRGKGPLWLVDRWWQHTVRWWTRQRRPARTAMLTRAGRAPPPHFLRFRFALWRRKVQLHVAIAWFKLLVCAQGPLVQTAIRKWRTVAATAMRLHEAAIAWEHTAEARHTRRLWRRWQARHTQPHPVQCQLSGGWVAWAESRSLCVASPERRRSVEGRRPSPQQQDEELGEEPEWLRLAAASLLLPASAAPRCSASVGAVDASDAPDTLITGTPAPTPTPTRGVAAEGDSDAAEGGGGAEAEGDSDAPRWLLQAEATLASSSSAAAATAAADPAAATTQPLPPAMLPEHLCLARRALATARCAAPLSAAAERAALQQSLWWWTRCTANRAMARAGRAVAHWLAMRGALRQMRRRAGWLERRRSRCSPLAMPCSFK